MNWSGIVEVACATIAVVAAGVAVCIAISLWNELRRGGKS